MRDDDLLEVHLLQFPVALWGRAKEHSDALEREFALMSMSSSGASAGGDHPIPGRLVELVTTVRAQYAASTSTQEEMLYAALDEGRDVIDDLVYRVPAHAADATRQLGEVYDEADRFCREGEHLLTLGSPDEVVVFRRWFLDEFVRQRDGQAPLPWPEHLAGQG